MRRQLSEKNILRLIVIIPILGIILTSIILTNIFINNQKEKYENDIVELKVEHLIQLKYNIKSRINRLVKIINSRNTENFKRSKEEIVDIISIAHNIVEDTYKKYINQGKEKVLTEIKRQLRDLRYFENDTGYIFIYDYSGKNILLPIRPELENTSQLNMKGYQGNYLVKDLIDLVKTKKEAFHTWYYYKDKKSKDMSKKIGYVKGFEPLNILIGTAKYYDEILKQNKEDALLLLNSIKFDKYGYIFVIDEKGTTLAHQNKNFINKRIDQVSHIEASIINNILKTANKHPKGNYLQYTPTSFNIGTKLSDKIAYVKRIDSFQWTIGTGSYTQVLKSKINDKTILLNQNLERTIRKTIYSSLIVTMPLIFTMLLISSLLKIILNRYAQELSDKNISLKELNGSLELRVKNEVIKNREKDDILHQSSKLAAMGEMLGNIAHQWRQPLSAISTSASGIKMQKEFNILTDELMNKELDTIVSSTLTLSQTIDDFRDFFQHHKKMERFKVKDSIEKVLLLISANLTNQNITIIKDIEEIETYSSKNELVQALLNILNNAKDILVTQPKEFKKFIFITVYLKNNKIFISIKDNAGGIKEQIIQKVFEPYFTTKFSSQGTGIGLHMTREIIKKTFKGEISVRNRTYTYEEKEYTGAEFTISFEKTKEEE